MKERNNPQDYADNRQERSWSTVKTVAERIGVRRDLLHEHVTRSGVLFTIVQTYKRSRRFVWGRRSVEQLNSEVKPRREIRGSGGEARTQ